MITPDPILDCGRWLPLPNRFHIVGEESSNGVPLKRIVALRFLPLTGTTLRN